MYYEWEFYKYIRYNILSTLILGVNKGPYGIVSVRELLRCLVQLCDSHNKNNSESMIHIGLTLLTVAFEVGADSIANFPSLMTIVKDDLCKYLIQVSCFHINSHFERI